MSKPFYINVYQDARGQWCGGKFSSRTRARKAAKTISSRYVGRLCVRMKKKAIVEECAPVKQSAWDEVAASVISTDPVLEKRVSLRNFSEQYLKQIEKELEPDELFVR